MECVSSQTTQWSIIINPEYGYQIINNDLIQRQIYIAKVFNFLQITEPKKMLIRNALIPDSNVLINHNTLETFISLSAHWESNSNLC